MPACVDYAFPGAVKPCLENAVDLEAYRKRFGQTAEPVPCLGSSCSWATCCNLSWKDESLGAPTAPLSGRMPTGQ
jgi:hypothetical protein